MKLIFTFLFFVIATSAFDWFQYYTLKEINIWTRSLEIKYPTWISLIELPTKTYEGRTMLVVKLDIPYCICEDNGGNKKIIFIESNLHAREWISSSVSTFLLNQLLLSKKGDDLFEIARRHIWYFLIIANPDGFAYTHTAAKFQETKNKSESARNWRKTRKPTPVIGCIGVDPNRNWPFHWNGDLTNGSVKKVDLPCDDIYPGTEPLSEPCVKAEHDFLKKIGSNMFAFIALHSYSQVLLLPYGHSSEKFDNYDEMEYIGTKAVNAMGQRYGTDYFVSTVHDFLQNLTMDWLTKEEGPRQCSDMCYCGLSDEWAFRLRIGGMGSSSDWVKFALRTPIVVTLELRPSRYETKFGFFELPEDQIIPNCLEAIDGIKVLIDEYEKLHPPKMLSSFCEGYCYVVNDWYNFIGRYF